ncbi:MAG: hypothetical protein OES79_05950 [Planctomycetota bacterium]|nr:hypothetical protein [Planctomycetota bacterium]
MANTADARPVFSFLVAATYRYISPLVFHIYYFVILGIYFYSLVGIASETFGMNRSSRAWFAYCVIIVGLHAPALGYLSAHATGVNFSRLLHDGLGHQYVLGPALQPASFGVFLILSLYVFLRGRPLGAVFCAGLAALFQPAYLLTTVAMIVSYMTVLIRQEGKVKQALLVGLVGCCLALPVLIHDRISFAATSTDALVEAQRILVDFRIPHATKPSEWFDYRALIQIAIVVIAIAGCRQQRIGPLLLIPFLASAVLTLGCLITQNMTVALLLPWQMFAVLVPVSTGLVVGGAVTMVSRKSGGPPPRYARTIDFVFIIFALLLVVSGVVGAIHKRASSLDREDAGLLEFVAGERRTGDLYLIPTEFDGFRLYTGSPVFVDERDYPRKDVEVIEWYRRLNLAKKFYAARGDTACDILDELHARYAVTHVVVRGDLQGQGELSGREWCAATLIFSDDHFRVYKLTRHE